MTVLTTARLRLEPFGLEHLDGLNAMNADPEVMRYISGRAETREETRAGIERIAARWRDVGYGWWAFLDHEGGQVVGAGCLQNLRRESTMEPDPACPLELGWRLRRDHQGRGLASEAAREIARWAFEARGAPELLAVCDPDNAASAAVMRRLGMASQGLQRWYGKSLLTYAIDAPQWRALAPASKAAG